MMRKSMKIAYVYTPPVPMHKRCSYLGACEHEACMILTTDYVPSGQRSTELACVFHAGAMVVNRMYSPLVATVTTTRTGAWKA
jgi:hypothetical protein